MNVLKTNALKPEKRIILEAVDYLNQSKIIIYPTDTVYGIGCRIDSLDSVKKIFMIKKRGLNKPLSIACSNMDMVKRYAVVDAEEEKFILENTEAHTFIVKKKNTVDDLITAGRDSVGVRLIPLPLVEEIVEEINCPLITSSANVSGRKAPVRVEEIDAGILNAVDLIINTGSCRAGKPSKVVDLGTGKIVRD